MALKICFLKNFEQCSTRRHSIDVAKCCCMEAFSVKGWVFRRHRMEIVEVSSILTSRITVGMCNAHADMDGINLYTCNYVILDCICQAIRYRK